MLILHTVKYTTSYLRQICHVLIIPLASLFHTLFPTDTDTSLLFLPGNHVLDRELLLAHVNSFSMTKDGLDNETTFVYCLKNFGRFHISETLSVSISKPKFIGCGDNIVSQVKWLTVTGSTFQGVQDKNVVLMLNKVSIATIVSSYFKLTILS